MQEHRRPTPSRPVVRCHWQQAALQPEGLQEAHLGLSADVDGEDAGGAGNHVDK
jgi:hypothetical protein